MNIKFENHSVSGIYREYAGFILNIPGHAIGNKAVVAKVPDELATDVKRYLAANHPAIVVTVEGEEAEPATVTEEPVVEPEPVGLEPEPTTAAVEPSEDGQGEEAEPAHRRGKKGGK